VSPKSRELRGRVTERAALQQLITRTRSSDSQVLVLRGEAGAGKTALLDEVCELASGFRCLRIAGVQTDMELAFAGLQQLCAPLMNSVAALPVPQREALNVAFGLGAGPAPDRFLVGLAVLSLLAAGAGDQPLLCVIDDAQWLDQVSVQTLGFVARRLLAEPIALVFGVRDKGAEALAGLPEIALGGLSDRDARDLLDSLVPGAIDPRVRDRILAETRGNPLALLEVPRSLTAAELAGGFWPVGARTSTGQVEEGFVRQIEALPEPTRRLLAAAAAEPLGDGALFLRAAAQLEIPVDAVAPAEAAELFEFGTRVRFRHPLIRSAAYRAAELTERREIHRVLAEVTDPLADPDRRAWHAASAAAGPDDAVAAQLEASAARAYSRGGVAAAAAFLERATVLTADPALRGSRAIAAAHAKREAAAPEAAYELLAIAELAPLSKLQRAQVTRMRAQMDFVSSRSGVTGALHTSDAAAQLFRAAQGLESLDDELARETYVEALTAAMYAGRLGEPTQLREIAEAGRTAVSLTAELARPIDFLLSGLTSRIIDGPGGGSEHLRIALELWNTHVHSDGPVVHWPFPIAQESAAHELWDDAVLQQIATEMVRRARDTGALAVLPPALAYRAGVHVYTGELSTAATLIDEANAITASMGNSPVKYHSLTLAAWRGDADEAVGAIETAAAEAKARGEGRLLALTRYTAAVLFNGLGRYEEALAVAGECCEYEDLGFFSWCLYELIEAAAHIGDRGAAEPALRRLEERAGASGTDWGLGAVASARALLAPDDAADSLFVEALTRLQDADIRPQVARTHLTYGEWLRRANRRNDARTHLSEAHAMWTRMGAQAFAERARRELIATGEKVRKQPASSGQELTAQEAQIARLAGGGLTNPEIGAQLFISTHTVEWHLRKVFVKLNITSRRQLRTMSWDS
jgi:DNA-binding CsgD family transcriptional regulator